MKSNRNWTIFKIWYQNTFNYFIVLSYIFLKLDIEIDAWNNAKNNLPCKQQKTNLKVQVVAVSEFFIDVIKTVFQVCNTM